MKINLPISSHKIRSEMTKSMEKNCIRMYTKSIKFIETMSIEHFFK